MKLHLAINKQKNKLQSEIQVSSFVGFFVFEGRSKKITKNAFVILSKRKGHIF
jgi:hypothetical protein